MDEVPGAAGLVLGLTGSFGSGKTTVAKFLAEAGARVLDADEIARQVFVRGAPALAQAEAEFGPGLVDAAGELDRAELARRAFATREASARLNSIVHPRVRHALEGEIASWRSQGANELLVLDVPLLFEAGFDALADKTVAVTVGEAARFGRLRQRGFGEAEVIARLARQMPQSAKARMADYIINNNGTLEATQQQTQELLATLQGEKDR